MNVCLQLVCNLFPDLCKASRVITTINRPLSILSLFVNKFNSVSVSDRGEEEEEQSNKW